MNAPLSLPLSKGDTLRIETPAVFAPLLYPARYKGAKGGRGSGKTHFFGELLVEDCIRQHIRAVCGREVQNTIADSSKQLIEDKINKLGVSSLFNVTDREISGPNDSLIIFRGLQKHTAGSIKSLEGYNRCWFDEAQTLAKTSLATLTPTFRNDAEMWFSWNPNAPTDPVDRLFADGRGDPDFICVEANYFDNPWFPPELRRDMERDKRRDPEKYAHVWLGKYLQKSGARVFTNWRIEEFVTPDNARFYYGADWGFSIDPTVLVRCYAIGRTMYVDQEAYEVGCEIDRTPQLFDKVPGSRMWPITADSARPETISYMQRHGYPKIRAALKGTQSVEDGIEFMKSYDIVVHPRCRKTIDELSFYSWKVDEKTEEILPVLEDKNNHVIDALRYAVESARKAHYRMLDVA